MRKIFVLAAFTCFIAPHANAQDFFERQSKSAEPAKKTRIEWKATLGGTFMNDSLASANIVGLYADTRFFHAFSELIAANAEAGLLLETGSTTSLYTDEFRPSQSISLYEARLNILPADFLSLHLGAINQSHHGSPIFIGGKTFPAALEFIQVPGIRPWLLSANAQQAIPTSQSLSTRAVGKEQTPLLYTENIRFGYRDPESFEFTGRATYFNFQNLTHGIAQDSRFYGNTVFGVGPLGATFFYNYQGVEAGIDAAVYFAREWRFVASSSFVNNAKAPRPKNRANFLSAGIGYLGSRVQITPRIGWLRVETDPIPAFYSSRTLGHDNRSAILAGLELRLVPEKLLLNANYVSSKVIETTPLQADRTYVEVRIGTEYDTI